MLMFYRIDLENGRLYSGEYQSTSVAPGEGPRHIAFHPNGNCLFLMNELGNTVESYSYNAESGEIRQISKVSSLPTDFNSSNLGADIHVHPNGKFLYASNRGHDSIAIFSIDQKSGKIEVVGHQSTLGNHPRNFTINPSGAFLLVANKDSNNIVIFNINKETGSLTPNGEYVEVSQPVCVSFIA